MEHLGDYCFTKNVVEVVKNTWYLYFSNPTMFSGFGCPQLVQVVLRFGTCFRFICKGTNFRMYQFVSSEARHLPTNKPVSHYSRLKG